VDAGRCETCKGEGSINVEMVFMADVQLPWKLVMANDLRKSYSKLHLLEKYSRYLDDDD
jgi:excinuclease ABC subunit A